MMTSVGGMGRGRSPRERTFIHIELTHFVVLQKLSHHCKAIILQFQKDKGKKLVEIRNAIH